MNKMVLVFNKESLQSNPKEGHWLGTSWMNDNHKMRTTAEFVSQHRFDVAANFEDRRNTKDSTGTKSTWNVVKLEKYCSSTDYSDRLRVKGTTTTHIVFLALWLRSFDNQGMPTECFHTIFNTPKRIITSRSRSCNSFLRACKSMSMITLYFSIVHG